MPVQLEPFLEKFLKERPEIDATQLPPEVIRQGERFDLSKLNLPAVLEEEKTIPTRAGGTVSLTITRPVGSENETLPVILFLHGGGWVIGSNNTHSPIRCELTTRAHAVVVFVNYSLSPEVRFPVAIEECYDALEWVLKNGASINADPSTLAVAGDSAGGNLSTVMCLLAKQRGLKDAIKLAILIYPVTDANFDTGSYNEFHEGYFLTRKVMKWFWDHYLPDEEERRKNILACPLNATLDDLRGLPRTLVITAEADVLRDEGEAYARKLMAAGVPVVTTRYLGMIHGVYNIGLLSPSAISAIDQMVGELKSVWAGKNKL
ncbi:hypothetical protein O0I10_008772 [Lichtheimia ornata]|uniref:Alpha/beta hydrolase fold-3 domain-containing protein n=1 Tax=Lichtheimia ornata TaxID=688661 RepID=A0AAD7UYX9_9FUNG|nr:uncharacterized protein O0I10_008772 [Lichtheimia ornata]KAJ8655486.1 hypothetical protein O0I10_008772 [Lichtheimia ornata]